ncbi:UAA transporter [Peniophora sp. CONT]|nr:UAA transporter [Peniophora sp. CONT]
MDTLSWSALIDWSTVLGLVFGGCCSNAISLERLTSEYPNVGSLITFTQFLLVSLHGLRKFLYFERGPLGLPLPKMQPRRVPLMPYLIQVVLYTAISVLNNAAFAYKIPMTVHIIFRSGGLVISLIMGWLLAGKRYSRGQVFAVLVVTAGVMLTTASAAVSKPKLSASATDAGPPLKTYLTGVSLLTLALVLGGLLGMTQDHIYGKYGATKSADPNAPAIWEESMFYMHFLSLPSFAFMSKNISSQATSLMTASKANMLLPIPSPFVTLHPMPDKPAPSASLDLHVPHAVVYLLLNAFTQLFCSAGVNRLTTKVTSLTVTLVLVVRKAVSLVLSVALFKRNAHMNSTQWLMLWSGAALVFTGTVIYASSSKPRPKPEKAKQE